MPCRQQLSDLFLCIISQGRDGDSFHVSYKNNCSLMATFNFYMVARSKLFSSGTQIQPLGFAWLHCSLQMGSAKATTESSESIPGLLNSRSRKGQGSFCWEKSQLHISCAWGEQRSLWNTAHWGVIWGFSASNHPGSSSKSCTQIGHP